MEINILFPRNKEEADYLIQIACAGKKSTRSEKSTTQILNETDWLMECKRKFIEEKWTLYEITNCRTMMANHVIKCSEFDRCCERNMLDVKTQKHFGVLEIPDMIVDIAGISRACSHQLVRHRLVTYLQQSQREVRISVDSDDWYVIPEIYLGTRFETRFRQDMKESAEKYMWYIEQGKQFEEEKRHKIEEDARFVLPNACKTNILVKTNLRQWLHIEYMRLDKHAQWEIRKVAEVILEKSKELYPLVFEDTGEFEV